MRVLIQRVRSAVVSIDGQKAGEIHAGLLLLIAISDSDDKATAEYMADKAANLRIFCDGDGKMNLSSIETGAEFLVASNFTLYADCRKGRRPYFAASGAPEKAELIYEYFLSCCKRSIKIVESGVFGANMQIALINDGPVTVMLDSGEIMPGR